MIQEKDAFIERQAGVYGAISADFKKSQDELSRCTTKLVATKKLQQQVQEQYDQLMKQFKRLSAEHNNVSHNINSKQATIENLQSTNNSLVQQVHEFVIIIILLYSITGFQSSS